MASLSRILVPVEFSPRCEMAARHAKALAAHYHSDITLLHVVAPVMAYGAPEALAYSAALDVAEDRVELAKSHLCSFLADGFGSLTVHRIVRQGDPAQQIVDCAAEYHSDLIVMPTHGYGPFRRFLLGSVTAKVLHDTCCPVWTGPHLERTRTDGEPRFEQVVCGVDLGPESAKVVSWAATLARDFGAKLTVVNAIPESTVHLEGAYFEPDVRQQVAETSRAEIDRLLDQAQAEGDVVFEVGDPADGLSSAASRLHADVLVIGRPGRHAGVLGFLRTHSYSIVREAPCPVAAV